MSDEKGEYTVYTFDSSKPSSPKLLDVRKAPARERPEFMMGFIEKKQDGKQS